MSFESEIKKAVYQTFEFNLIIMSIESEIRKAVYQAFEFNLIILKK